jgi:hypothetical protein
VEFKLLSDLIASFVENIRVNRLVIDGFSGGRVEDDFCGSEGGAACPLPLRFSVLGTAATFFLVGRDSGEPTREEVCEAGGEGLVGIWLSLGTLTVAMIIWLFIEMGGWLCERVV